MGIKGLTGAVDEGPDLLAGEGDGRDNNGQLPVDLALLLLAQQPGGQGVDGVLGPLGRRGLGGLGVGGDGLRGKEGDGRRFCREVWGEIGNESGLFVTCELNGCCEAVWGSGRGTERGYITLLGLQG